MLFVDDIRILSLPKSLDEVFMSLNCISLVIFLLEIIMSSLAIKGYFFGFYFWLDSIATLSLITDITWIWYPIVGIDNSVEKAIDSEGNFDPNLLIESGTNTAT